MADKLTNLGEEYNVKNDWRGTDVTLLLYNDSSDSLDDTNDLSDVTTEPTDGNYTRQTLTIDSAAVKKINGDWGWELSTTFDVTDTTGDVDSTGGIVTFQAKETGDSTVNDHLIVAGFLSQTRTLSNYDNLKVTLRVPFN
jgi:hypothetical protein